MNIVCYSVVLNQHQAPIADELWTLTNHKFTFVELVNLYETKGGLRIIQNDHIYYKRGKVLRIIRLL